MTRHTTQNFLMRCQVFCISSIAFKNYLFSLQNYFDLILDFSLPSSYRFCSKKELFKITFFQYRGYKQSRDFKKVSVKDAVCGDAS